MCALLAGKEDLVVGDRNAADAAISRRLVRARARLPDQTARFAVERLDDVARRREIDDAVVHDRGRLVRTRIVHRPHPLQLQVLHVGGGDLIQRAVAVAVIVPPEDEPVARRRVLQHLRRDGHVVLHLAGDRDTARGGFSASSTRRGARADDRRQRAPAAATRSSGRRRGASLCNGADGRFDPRRQRLHARRAPLI